MGSAPTGSSGIETLTPATEACRRSSRKQRPLAGDAGCSGPQFGCTSHHICGNGWGHEAVEGLGNAQIDQIDPGCDQRGIEFNGASEELQAVLHAVALERLPLMVPTLINFVGFPTPGAFSALDERLSGSADRQAWSVPLLWRYLLKTDAGNCGTAWRGGAWWGMAVVWRVVRRNRCQPRKRGAASWELRKPAPGTPCSKEAECQAVNQFRFEAGESASIHQQVFNPDLRAFADENHLSAQAEMRRQSAQGSGEHQVGIERFADLLCRESAEGECENRVPGQDGNGWIADAGQPGNRLLCDGLPKMLGDAEEGGERRDGEPRESSGLRGTVRPYLGREAVSAFIDGLNALFRLKYCAQRGEAFGDTVRGDVYIAPQRLFQLLGRNDLAGTREQELKRRQLSRRQVNRLVSAEERAIGFKAEDSKGES